MTGVRSEQTRVRGRINAAMRAVDVAVADLERTWEECRPTQFPVWPNGRVKLTSSHADEMLTAWDFGRLIIDRMHALFSHQPLAQRYRVARRTVDDYTRGHRVALPRSVCAVRVNRASDRSPHMRMTIYLPPDLAVWLLGMGLERYTLIERAISQYRRDHELLESN